MSDMNILPPGLSMRCASRNTASLSGARLMTQLEMMTSTESPFERRVLHLREVKLHIGRAEVLRVLARQLYHVRRHIYADDLAFRADRSRRDEAVDAAAAAEIDHRLAGVQVAYRRGVAAARRRQQRLVPGRPSSC